VAVLQGQLGFVFLDETALVLQGLELAQAAGAVAASAEPKREDAGAQDCQCYLSQAPYP
jgi:hypothetical protein